VFALTLPEVFKLNGLIILQNTEEQFLITYRISVSSTCRQTVNSLVPIRKALATGTIYIAFCRLSDCARLLINAHDTISCVAHSFSEFAQTSELI